MDSANNDLVLQNEKRFIDSNALLVNEVNGQREVQQSDFSNPRVEIFVENKEELQKEVELFTSKLGQFFDVREDGTGTIKGSLMFDVVNIG